MSNETASDEGAFAVARPRLGAFKAAAVGVRHFANTIRLDARAETRLVAMVVDVACEGGEVEQAAPRKYGENHGCIHRAIHRVRKMLIAQ